MKPTMRKQIRRRLSALSPEALSDKSRLACDHLVGLAEFRAAQVVMAFLPMAEEPDTTQVILKAWRQGKTVLAPKVNWDKRHIIAAEITSLNEGLGRGKFGILEPVESFPHPSEQIDFVLVPGMAFDRKGGRLGRGGGFYDRFLAGAKLRAAACGFAFAEQVVEDLPREAHDREVDILVTDEDILRFNA